MSKIDIVDELERIRLHVNAVEEITDQLSEIYGANKSVDLFEALDVARKATLEQLRQLIKQLEKDVMKEESEE